jgi:hypothetical protein
MLATDDEYQILRLSNSRGRSSSWSRRSLATTWSNTVRLGLCAVLGDVADLAAAIAGLAALAVEWAAVGGGAVAGDVTELAASIALHALGLAIARIVVGATALVAGGSTGSTTAIAATETTTTATESARRRWGTSSSWAVAL